jgi:hypothetical protein
MEVLEHPGDAGVVLGIDVPIGVPLAWARQTGVRAFTDVLTRMTDGTWPRFAEPATVPQEIAPGRPFYPRAPGGTSRAQLVQGLGLQDEHDLRRRCDAAVPGAMPAAAPLFWLVGAQQVGRAALTAWQDVIAPLMQLPHVRLWPMDGHLGDLAQAGHTSLIYQFADAGFYRVDEIGHCIDVAESSSDPVLYMLHDACFYVLHPAAISHYRIHAAFYYGFDLFLYQAFDRLCFKHVVSRYPRSRSGIPRPRSCCDAVDGGSQ